MYILTIALLMSKDPIILRQRDGSICGLYESIKSSRRARYDWTFGLGFRSFGATGNNCG